jgi:phosphoglycolate phosphatase-like HAD superfamily hydrolase
MPFLKSRLVVCLLAGLVATNPTMGAMAPHALQFHRSACPSYKTWVEREVLMLALSSTDQIGLKSGVVFVRATGKPFWESLRRSDEVYLSAVVATCVIAVWLDLPFAVPAILMARQDYWLDKLDELNVLKPRGTERDDENYRIPSHVKGDAPPRAGTALTRALKGDALLGPELMSYANDDRSMLNIVRVVDEGLYRAIKQIDELFSGAHDSQRDYNARIRDAFQAYSLLRRVEKEFPRAARLWLLGQYEFLALDLVKGLRRQKDEHTRGLRLQLVETFNGFLMSRNLVLLSPADISLEAPLRYAAERLLDIVDPNDRLEIDALYDQVIRERRMELVTVFGIPVIQAWQFRPHILLTDPRNELTRLPRFVNWIETLGGGRLLPDSPTAQDLLSQNDQLEPAKATLKQILARGRIGRVIYDYDDTAIKREEHDRNAALDALRMTMIRLATDVGVDVLSDEELIRQLDEAFSADALAQKMGVSLDALQKHSYRRYLADEFAREQKSKLPQTIAGWKDFLAYGAERSWHQTIITPNRAVYREVEGFRVRHLINKIRTIKKQVEKTAALRAEVLRARRDQNIGPSQIAFFSDSPKDLAAAQSLGIVTVAVGGSLLDAYDASMANRISGLYQNARWIVLDYDKPAVFQLRRAQAQLPMQEQKGPLPVMEARFRTGQTGEGVVPDHEPEEGHFIYEGRISFEYSEDIARPDWEAVRMRKRRPVLEEFPFGWASEVSPLNVPTSLAPLLKHVVQRRQSWYEENIPIHDPNYDRYTSWEYLLAETTQGSLFFVLNELLKNASDAYARSISKTGVIVVQALLHPDRLIIEISDNGIGIHHIHRDPSGALYLSSNPRKSYEPSLVEGGLRIGVPWSQLLINLHGGSLEFLSQAVNGFETTVRITFPRQAGSGAGVALLARAA